MLPNTQKNTLSNEDLAILKEAKKQMEAISWAMKGLNSVGNVLQNKLELLPEKQQKWLHKISYDVLLKVVKTNLFSMQTSKTGSPLNKTYKALVTSSGILGGTFGVAAFTADLALTTKLMMRSIMDIARSEGEDLQDLDTQLACLQVFALGGKSKHDDNLETGYFATRITLNSTVKGATKGAGKLVTGILKGSTNPLIKIIGAVASRFSIQVSEKFVAQVIPIIGAAGGGAINLAFIHHFQSMAKAHFAIRKLERNYGEENVKLAYENISIK